MFFLGFSRFLVLENLENPKKHNVFFEFSGFFEKSKKHNDFFWIFVGFHRKIQKHLFFLFGFSKFLLLEILENPKKSYSCFLDFRLF